MAQVTEEACRTLGAAVLLVKNADFTNFASVRMHDAAIAMERDVFAQLVPPWMLVCSALLADAAATSKSGEKALGLVY